MNSTNTETLNWQDIISGWSFTCGGEAPPESLAESVVPAVERTNDGIFEITTVSFGFSGTAPYHQQKFTAAFSFSVAGTANFYEIAVSSDDTATVNLGGNAFVSAELNRNGVASSAWNETAEALPEVSGTFETVGGPYALSVTITLKRLVGAEWIVSQNWTESGPYEIKTATLSFSGNARSDTLGFSWNSPSIDIDGGNWIEINVEADDEATITAGTYSKKATLHGPVEFNSGWLENAPDTFPLSVSYRNAGGPYRLSVIVTVKRSLRMLELGFWYAPPMDENAGVNDNYPISSRRRIGVGETLKLYVQNKNNKATSLGTLSACVVQYPTEGQRTLSCSDEYCLIPGSSFFVEGVNTIIATFGDGEILREEVEVLFPRRQTWEEIVEKRENSYTEITYDENTGKATERKAEVAQIKKYKVKVLPADENFAEAVSFKGLLFWECTGEYNDSGIFTGIGEDEKIHKPARKTMPLGNENEWIDTAGFWLFEFPKKMGIVPYLESSDYLEAKIGDCLGTLIWTIPVRWTVAGNPDLESTPNDDRDFIGTIVPENVQTARCIKIQRSDGTPFVELLVNKTF